MPEHREALLEEARNLTRFSGQWLRLLGFQPHPAAPTFSPSLSVYHDMLDPGATDGARFAACTALKSPVMQQVRAEQSRGEAKFVQTRPVDPYGLELRTTCDGAALEVIAGLLSKAVNLFDAAGIRIKD